MTRISDKNDQIRIIMILDHMIAGPTFFKSREVIETLQCRILPGQMWSKYNIGQMSSKYNIGIITTRLSSILPECYIGKYFKTRSWVQWWKWRRHNPTVCYRRGCRYDEYSSSGLVLQPQPGTGKFDPTCVLGRVEKMKNWNFQMG